MEIDEVAEWGEKGTQINRYDEDSFDEEYEQQETTRERGDNKAEKDLIKKKI
jgi:hypothetical protein